MTDLIRLALEWVRAALLGRRTPAKHRRPAAPQETLQAPPATPTPAVLGARPVTARRGRPAPPQPRDREAEEVWEPTGAMVRPYVANLGTSPRNTQAAPWAGPWANPWTDAR